MYGILYIALVLLCAALGAGLLLWFRVRHQRWNPGLNELENYRRTQFMGWADHSLLMPHTLHALEESGSGPLAGNFMLFQNWVDSDGNELEPFTIITEEKVRSGEFRPAPHAGFTVDDVLRYFEVVANLQPVFKGVSPHADEFEHFCEWPPEFDLLLKGSDPDTYPHYVAMHPDRIPGSSKIKGE